MTTAIPFFMVHLNTIVTALNQNPVKLETSKVVSVYERQVLAKIHRLLFRFDETFYDRYVQEPDSGPWFVCRGRGPWQTSLPCGWPETVYFHLPRVWPVWKGTGL
jgi:hypothetical protein